MFSEGIVKPGEICPGLTWEEHADSVARFMDRKWFEEFGETKLYAWQALILSDIDGDPSEVKAKYAELERNS